MKSLDRQLAARLNEIQLDKKLTLNVEELFILFERAGCFYVKDCPENVRLIRVFSTDGRSIMKLGQP